VADDTPELDVATSSQDIPSVRRENGGEGGIRVKAIRTHGRGGPEQLFFEDAPLPEVRRGDVLLQVRATGITPTELTWDETYQNADGAPRIPSIPGHEVSGVVERMAPDVTDFRPGTRYMAWLTSRVTERLPSLRPCRQPTWR
jgi:NADPH:quinone reductase-like Zn-dependent oxidoreductase